MTPEQEARARERAQALASGPPGQLFFRLGLLRPRGWSYAVRHFVAEVEPDAGRIGIEWTRTLSQAKVFNSISEINAFVQTSNYPADGLYAIQVHPIEL